IAHKWGETLYGIGILPLGGYVKMLGQDDDPAHIAEQMQKSQVDSRSADGVQVTGPNGEKYYVDRRSYLAKSVPQRMAIISAGVIMNVIFAFIFAVIAYGMGVKYMPSIISETVPGSPAWRAGLEPGDEIVKLGDVPNPTFLQLKTGVTLGDLKNGIPCIVRRASDGKDVTLTLRPEQESGQLALIGIVPAFSTTLLDRMPTIDDSPAAVATLIAPPKSELKTGKPKLQGGDSVVRVGENAVSSYRDLAAELARVPNEPLRFTVNRPEKKSTAADATAKSEELTFEVQPHLLRDLGLTMRMGPIVAVQEGSPADTAGLKAGDVIETIDGQAAGATGGWTPDTLPDLMRQAAEAGREVEIIVLRPSATAASGEQITTRVKPRIPTSFNTGLPLGAPQGVEALGIAYRVDNEVLAIVPSGSAADSEIKPGDRLIKAKVVFPKDSKGIKPEPLTVEFISNPPGGVFAFLKSLFGSAPPDPQTLFNWTALVDVVQFVPSDSVVELTFERGEDAEKIAAKLKPSAIEGVFDPARGFRFDSIERTRTAATFKDQLKFGWNETVESLTMVVRFLQKLGTQVPVTMLGGPGTIAAAAGGAASQGLSSLLIFLTMLSANLAVINFLPIPLLDGGHMMFLAYEGLRGRPANEKVVVALHTIGFVFIICLMLFVIGLDIQRWVSF
ncbi:MAG: site-2 protease family protein, partial [Pirellulales bacterium]